MVCSDDGYPYKVIPYQGKSESKHEGLLGSRVVKELLDVVIDNDASYHDVYFDNYFTSIPLLEDLRTQGIRATGTVRCYRLHGAPFPPAKEMQKKERGTIEVCSTSNVCVVQWVDNKAVILASNHQTHEPINTCKRYSRSKKARLDINQPHVICKYNAHMGGVDQLDGYLNNLRPCIGGKKWYWTQLINLVRLLQVAAFRLYHHLNPDKKLSQLQFLRNLVHQYARVESKKPRLNSSIPRIVSKDSNGHFLTSTSQGRCAYCKKNCRLLCEKCNKRMHQLCFPLYHDD